MKKTFEIKNLDCAVCAGKVAAAINIPRVTINPNVFHEGIILLKPRLPVLDLDATSLFQHIPRLARWSARCAVA